MLESLQLPMFAMAFAPPETRRLISTAATPAYGRCQQTEPLGAKLHLTEKADARFIEATRARRSSNGLARHGFIALQGQDLHAACRDGNRMFELGR